jgi:predicted metal-dependent hydrolase
MMVRPTSVTVKVMKSRWGSCNVKTGALCFALDLVTKPEPCIESVVVHELNHLLETGHTPRFHALMAHWLPDYKERTKILTAWPREFI